MELTVSTVCGSVCVCMCKLHCLHAQSERTLIKLSLYHYCHCVASELSMMFAQLELVQCGEKEEAILFHSATIKTLEQGCGLPLVSDKKDNLLLNVGNE